MSRHSHSKFSLNRAFTLIELLVVIAIIGIL
ncbi:MAG: type II secretion system protein, partial [Candidatus Taylorbacteria bacterium]